MVSRIHRYRSGERPWGTGGVTGCSFEVGSKAYVQPARGAAGPCL
ncbi:hypothetical protein [Streptomyces sp. KR55]